MVRPGESTQLRLTRKEQEESTWLREKSVSKSSRSEGVKRLD